MIALLAPNVDFTVKPKVVMAALLWRSTSHVDLSVWAHRVTIMHKRQRDRWSEHLYLHTSSLI